MTEIVLIAIDLPCLGTCIKKETCGVFELIFSQFLVGCHAEICHLIASYLHIVLY